MFERTEIKDIVAYLRLIANDDDDPAFVRALAAPKRGVGADDACAAWATSRRRAHDEPVRAPCSPSAGGVGARAAARRRSTSSAR